MTAGGRDQLVAIERNEPIENARGDMVDNWVPVTRAWARVIFGRGSERRQAAREQVVQAATFIVLSEVRTRAVSADDHRIIHNHAVWDVVAPGVANSKGEIEFDTRRAGMGSAN